MGKQVVALATDEKTIVMWDIDAVLSDCKDHPCMTVSTEWLLPENWLTIDEAHALTTDVTIPLVLFELPNDQLFIADGNHRLYRAAAEHIPHMNVRIIPQETHLSYLFECSPDVYRQVIEGLTDEGIFIHNFTHH